MSDALQVSVLIYTAEYPERTERCMEFLNRQKGVQIDIRMLVAKESLRDMKKQFPQIPEKNFYTVPKQRMSGAVSEALRDCMYENILFLSSDTLYEEDTLEKLILSKGSADGLVFNYSIIRGSIKCTRIYPKGFACKNLFAQKKISLPDREQYFSAENIYESYPNIWNHLFSKRILQQHKIRLDDFTRISQYLFIAEYHSYCRTLAVDTSLFVYREHQGEKITPDTGFCIRHYFETTGMVRRGYKRFTPDTVRILMNDFRVSPRQVGLAVRRKMKKPGEQR